jgi:hypothetical protein
MTLKFGANIFDVDQSIGCNKVYLYTNAGPLVARSDSSEGLLQSETTRTLCRAVAPNDATSLSVTWNFQEEQKDQNNLTRYIISLERYTGCALTPIIKFQVPVSEAPVDDCTLVLKSKLKGTTQPFRVKVCAGEAIFVSISKILEEDCPVQCGVPTVTTPATNMTALSVALVSVFLF